MMRMTTDTKRFSGMLLAMLVFSAFIMPACSLAPSVAMAMPAEGGSMPCGSEGTVMEACPMGKPMSGSPSPAPVTDVQAIAGMVVEPLTLVDSGEILGVIVMAAHDSPPDHLTPLRI